LLSKFDPPSQFVVRHRGPVFGHVLDKLENGMVLGVLVESVVRVVDGCSLGYRDQPKVSFPCE
jgi:hypothetical protein